ncbi:phage holin family protein [Patescibacteria group bacterium]|nr:phage holin family protein [Patescibacteria group bacterium]
MLKNIIKFLINGFAVYATAYLLSGVNVSNFMAALIVALVLAILNMLAKPFLIILSLPITILTLGLFTFVIDAIIVLFASTLIPDFTVDTFWTAMLFSVVLAIVSYILHKIVV